ncbi:MAG: hypothetical protein NTW21_07930 [Verrucomicrobia bacterium]|nr:hypothetical protein [Verrucomicrobiota bacterium]
MIRRIVMIFLVAVIPLLANQEERLGGRFSLTLPEGFVHMPGKGIDTNPGDIFGSKSGLEIHYDIGIYSGARELIKKWRAQELKLMTIPLQPEMGTAVLRIIEAKERWVVFATENDIYFTAKIRTDKDLDDFTTIVSSVRLMERPDSTKTKAEPAGAAQPATKPADKVPAEVQPPTPTSKDYPR